MRTATAFVAALVLSTGCTVGEEATEEDGSIDIPAIVFGEDDPALDELQTAWNGDDSLLTYATGNLLPNGGFESGVGKRPNAWSLRTGNPADVENYGVLRSSDYLYRTTEAARTGGSGIRIRTATDMEQYALAVTAVGGVPGRKYTLSVATRRISGDQQRLMIEFVSKDFESLGTKTFASGWSKTWHTLTQDFTAPRGTNTIFVAIGDSGDTLYNSTHDWDAMKLVAH
jgi:hypothetical protein